MIKTRQDNNMTDYIGVVCTENEIELSWPIEPGAFCGENHTRQQHDWSYMCGYDENDTELLWSIGLGMVCHEQYSKNDVTGHTCAVYSQNEIKLSWLIELCAIYEENQIEQQCD